MLIPNENTNLNPHKNPLSVPPELPNERSQPELPVVPLRDAPTILKNPRIRSAILEQNESSKQEFVQGFHSGPVNRRKGFVLIAFSWTAAFMDSVFLIGTTMIFLASFHFVTKYSFGLILASDRNLILQLGLLMFVGVSLIYLIMLRSVLGFTLGEWACSLRLGSPRERQSQYYPLKVILRTLVIYATGVLPLPLLGLLFGSDLAGWLSGVRLTSLK